ncbi:mandelate racemase/muconate lactonizing enzyme family protein [Vibrio mangrovi]|uniref:D-galactonate dehydratase n=1 Tax=Vibrio mangrovi TaxID=474394 RepID=A0A1Y6IWB3_9VIBR|nr:mandelate racemase/muconate lactonizing enzyme family protein [Vibrio mangrovi]MDW6004484.1 mandelate racemase/muconate lactonizing enzyme family protein [Vibrio mangrovi]SMS00772.1 D-galactonate dehydratase [Vibrio mangrovi]
MKIVQLNVYDVDLKHRAPYHNLLVIEIETDQGVSGIGEVAMSYGVGAKSVIPVFQEIANNYLIGKSPFDSESIYQTTFDKSYWARGRSLAIYGAMSAIDMALWDIKGKILNTPIFNLLGGKVRDSIRLYANHWYFDAYTPEHFADNALKVVEDGYTGLKFDPFKMSPNGEKSTPSRPITKEWGEMAIARVAAVRQAVGDEVDIMLDLHGCLCVSDAIKWGRRLEEFSPYFYEEPTDSLLAESSIEVKHAVNMPIAGGERLYTRFDFAPFIENRVFELIQPDMGLAGGFTEMKKIASYADTHQIQVQPHNASGPVLTAACVQFDFCTINVPIQEWFPYWQDERYNILNESLEQNARKGQFVIDENKPGLGVELNKDYLSKFTSFNFHK